MAYAANCPISMPIYIPGVIPDADFGGLMFSYQWGPMYWPTGPAQVALRPPEDV